MWGHMVYWYQLGWPKGKSLKIVPFFIKFDPRTLLLCSVAWEAESRRHQWATWDGVWCHWRNNRLEGHAPMPATPMFCWQCLRLKGKTFEIVPFFIKFDPRTLLIHVPLSGRQNHDVKGQLETALGATIDWKNILWFWGDAKALLPMLGCPWNKPRPLGIASLRSSHSQESAMCEQEMHYHMLGWPP